MSMDEGLENEGRSPEPLTWTEAETAARIGISVPNLKRRRREGSAPPHALVGRRILYRPADVAAWLARHVRGLERAG